MKTESRLVRKQWAELSPCRCGLTPVCVTFTSALGVTHHRVECPECDNPAVRWEWSHEAAADAWNAQLERAELDRIQQIGRAV